MDTVKIQTSQNIDIDYEVAGLGDRVLARLIDLGIFIGLVIVFAVAASTTSSSEVFTTALIVIYVCVFVFYDLLCEVFFNGQSLGKRAMKIKVISIDGSRPSLSQYLLRWLFRIIDFAIGSGICALICVAVSDKKQRVGDMVAGTTLIKTMPRAQIDSLVFNPVTTDDYTPVYMQVASLTDQDVTLIHEVLTNFKKTDNAMLIYNMAIRIKDNLSITTPPEMNDYQFLQLIVKDYNHIAAGIAND